MKSQEQLAADFRRVGIREGDNLILHSSFKSLGPVQGGPATVVEAVLSVLGESGNLMVPTFTYCLPMWNTEPFEIKNTKSRVGAITEAVRTHPRALRSFHPTHSVAAIGPDAEDIVANHMHATPIGIDSPFGRMHRRHAKILMLGTKQDTNSSLHYCEVLAPVPYINVTFSNDQDYEIAWFTNEDGRIEYTQILEVPGCSRGFREVETPLIRSGVLKAVTVGIAPSQLMETDTFIPAACELLTRHPAILLCDTANCVVCPKRKEFLKRGSPL